MTRRGMTMVELLAALVVTGLAATIGTATLALLTDRRAPLREASSATERSAAVRRTLIAWIEDAHGARSPFSGAGAAGFQLLDLTSRGGPADQLLFTTTAATPLGSADAIVRLYVDGDPRTPEQGLVADLSPWAGGPATRIELDSTVTGLDVQCLTDVGGAPRWLPSFISPQRVPRGVELRLRGARPRGLDPLLALPIRVVVEAGR